MTSVLGICNLNNKIAVGLDQELSRYDVVMVAPAKAQCA
jgi:hypothetical protein